MEQRRFTTKDFLAIYQRSLEKALTAIYDTILRDPASAAFKEGSPEFINSRVSELTSRVFSRELHEAMKHTKCEIERLNDLVAELEARLVRSQDQAEHARRLEDQVRACQDQLASALEKGRRAEHA